MTERGQLSKDGETFGPCSCADGGKFRYVNGGPACMNEDDLDLCGVCGGEGWIMAADGDGSDWGEDTYAGPIDAVIACRHCNGGGLTK